MEKERKQKNIIIVIFVLIFVMLVLPSVFVDNKIVKEVKTGEKTLTCEFSDGWRDVPKEKIIGLNDNNGYWEFTNGYARNCEAN